MTQKARAMFLLPMLLFVSALPLLAKEAKKMNLTSTAFVHSGGISALYTCDGKDQNPPLIVSGVPQEAKSLALIMDDPDAPGGDWVHWVLWNLAPQTKEIAQATLPAGAISGKNSWGRPGYGGPCPPSGTHRYYFRLYALKGRLELPPGATRKELDRAMRGNVLAACELMGTYRRK